MDHPLQYYSQPWKSEIPYTSYELENLEEDSTRIRKPGKVIYIQESFIKSNARGWYAL